MLACLESLRRSRFRLAVFGLLCSATTASLLLFRLRVILSDSIEYVFLVWNLFLAWIPLGIAYGLSVLSQKRPGPAPGLVPAAGLLWLIFFPNAPYLLTDLQHLGIPKPGVPMWFDMLLLLWFAWTGLLLGLVSLFMVHRLVVLQAGRLIGWAFVLGVSVLSGLGIYIGRFLRWNSWDVFLRPLERIPEFMYYASHPSPQSILFIGIISALLIFLYITLYAFGLLFVEQGRQA
jgi:uncharacterized membrane protein